MTAELFTFLGTSLVVLFTPGPAVMYIVNRSVDQGKVAGVVSALGMATGSFVHVLFATFGLSLILSLSASVFTVVRYIGAAYIIYLGVRKLMAKVEVEGDEREALKGKKLSKVYFQSVIVNVLNPKIAMFFLLFLPQFVNTGTANVSVQIMSLGIAFVLMGICTDSSYALLSGSVGEIMKRSTLYKKIQNKVSGVIFIGLGIYTALSGSKAD